MQLSDLRLSEEFDNLDQAAKSLLSSLLNNETVFTSQMRSQTITITDLHLDTRAIIHKEGEKTRTEILTAMKSSYLDNKDQNVRQNAVFPNNVENPWIEHSRLQDMILQSLRFPTMTDRYEAVKEAHAKTFEWVLPESDETERPWDNFSDWLTDGDGIYWVSGKAGSGKSTLMRYIRDNPRLRKLLQTWTGPDKGLTIATFFFWISGVSDQSSQVGLLRSLLFEVLSSKRHLIEATLPELWSSLRSAIEPVQYSQTYSWTPAKATSSFKKLFSIISQDTGHVFLLIDGLDEYQGDPGDTVELLQSVISPNVKMCVSSRPWQVFEVAFKRVPRLRLQDLTAEDISRFVNDKLRGNAHMQQMCIIDLVGTPKFIEEIVEKAEGVFLWVILVVRSFLNGLRNGDSISDLRKRLEEIPSEIEDLYNYMLSKIEPIYFETGRKLFSLVQLAFSQELTPWSSDGMCALRLSFAMDEDDGLLAGLAVWTEAEIIRRVEWVNSRLKVCCAGLLDLSAVFKYKFPSLHGNRSVHYIHRTAREFLRPQHSQKWPIWIHPAIADKIPVRMMRADLIHLKAIVHSSTPSTKAHSLRRIMWLAHEAEREKSYQYAEILDTLAEIDPIRDFVCIHWTPSSERDNILRHICIIENPTDWSNDFLSIAISWELNFYVEQKLGSGKGAFKAKRGRPYLDYVLRRSYYDWEEVDWNLKTISVLLEYGGDPNQYYCVSKQQQQQRKILVRSTPWEAVIHTAHVLCLRFNDQIFKEVVAPLFELLLSHGADPRISYSCNRNDCCREGNRDTISVDSIMSQYLHRCPEECRRILELLDAARRTSSPSHTSSTSRTSLPPYRGRFSRLKNQLRWRK